MINIYRCPECSVGRLSQNSHDMTLVCTKENCGAQYPIVNECPVLICEKKSLFSHEDYTGGAGRTTMDLQGRPSVSVLAKTKRALLRMVPPLSISVADHGPQDVIDDIADVDSPPTVLVIGAGDQVFETAGVNIIYSDVALGGLTNIIADAHDLPFVDESIDLVIAVAVLEHVIRPHRVVSEITRVLSANGIIYSNTPFMQQVHMGRYDFTRFTALGHRFLWRDYDEIRSGISNGIGMTVVWSVEYFLRALFMNSKLESLACYAARFLTFPFILFDRFLRESPGLYDGASAYYFTGKKRNTPLSDAHLIQLYKGKQK